MGVSLRGAVSSGPLGLNYVFEYGSSDTIRDELNGSGREQEFARHEFVSAMLCSACCV
jgi:hypothetical protein